MKPKVCFIASSGGHLDELSMLKPLICEYDSFLVTEKTKYKIKNSAQKIYYLNQINRKELFFIPYLIKNIVKSLIIFIKERPDFIISTGVLSTIPMCLLGKIFKKKVIYIESFAIVSKPTKTGKLLYKFADRFYVQWEEMKKFYPEAIYKGGVLVLCQ